MSESSSASVSDDESHYILPEDDYVKKMEEIIERTYYPKNTELKNELMVSKSINDANIAEIPENEDGTESMTLDKFLNTYSGEDNASFEKLSKKESLKKAQEYAHFYQNEGTKLLEATNTDEGKPHALALNAWKYTARNALMYNPGSCDFSESEIAMMGNRGKPVINPEATRLDKSHEFMVQQKLDAINNKRTQLLEKQGKMQIDGNVYKSSEYAPNDVNSFVDYAEPKILAVPASPMMTWGHVESTPARIEEDRVNKTEFRILPASEREELAHNLGSGISKNTVNAIFKTPTRSIRDITQRATKHSVRSKMLSPAAQKLFKNSIRSGGSTSTKCKTYMQTPVFKIVTPKRK